MKKLLSLLMAGMLLISMAACSSNTDQKDSENKPEETPVVETFSAEYEMVGTTSAGLPKNDTFIFEGTTTDGIITELNFDIIRNKGLDGEYSKKTLMGYLMNVSDSTITTAEDGTISATIGMNGYETKFGQYMITGVIDNLSEDSQFKDMVITNYTGEVLNMEDSLMIYQYLANEAGITLTEETPVKDLLAISGLYADGAFVAEGNNRVSFAGFHGGRSYGEQIDAIVDYILANKMTLEDVYEMFKTVNQQSEPIEERDTISGATIAFVGDFQRMVYLAIHGELFEGVVNSTTTDGQTVIEVATQGFGGEIETHVTFDDESGKIVSISVRDAQESEDVGAVLTADDSDFINALIAGQEDIANVETVSGATVTSESLIKAVQFAQEYYAGN